MLRLVLRKVQRLVEQRLVFDETARFDATGCANDCFRRRVVDSGCQLVGCETAEYDRVHRPDPGAGQDGNDGFRDHRHVDDDAVALLDAVIHEHACEQGHFVAEFAVANGALGARHRAVVDDRRLFAPAIRHVAV